MTRRRVHGIVHFPWALPVAPGALGLGISARIDGRPVRMTLPVEDQLHHLVAPPVKPPLRSPLPETFAGEWGYRSATDLYFVAAARATFLLSGPDDAATSDDFLSLGRSFYDWFDIVREWLAAWTGQPIGQRRESRQSAFYVPRSGGTLSGSGATLGSIVILGPTGATADQVRGALVRASRGIRLPVEHRLLLDADDAMLRQDLRRAVIDAASALEVALATSLVARLAWSGVSTSFAETVVKQANGALGLASLYTELVGPLPVSKGKLGTELAEPRNRAAHSGVPPSKEVARVALSRAWDVVRAARPLSAK